MPRVGFIRRHGVRNRDPEIVFDMDALRALLPCLSSDFCRTAFHRSGFVGGLLAMRRLPGTVRFHRWRCRDRFLS